MNIMYFENNDKLVKIQQAIQKLRGQMACCVLCPRDCRVDRTAGKKGFCQVTDKIKIYKYKLHHGEEPPISGTNGSGIIFFSGCTMKCAFCQNYPFSQRLDGYEITEYDLCKIMLTLQEQGAHNINLVTASHFIPGILKALLLAIKKGLNLPIIYNSNGFEKAEILHYLEGIIDIYLPDMKYSLDSNSFKYSRTKAYFEQNKQAVIEMFRQTGHLKLKDDGLARRGLLIRHLILPNDLSGTERILKFISENFGKDTYISLMTQYLPIWNSSRFPEIDRRINFNELEELYTLVDKYHLSNGWIQKLDTPLQANL